MAFERKPGFERSWTAEVLQAAPLIAPARQYVWPMRIAGEEDALARGAVQVMVRPAGGGAYLVTAALGFRDPSIPSGVFGCPNSEEICVVAGGYGYIARADEPEQVTMLAMKPVVAVLEAEVEGLLLFVGFQTVLAWRASGLAWETGRLSWEGVRVTGIEGGRLKGFGWDLMRDLEVEFEVDLGTGKHVGGGYSGGKA
jgi:hypothetical protein